MREGGREREGEGGREGGSEGGRKGERGREGGRVSPFLLLSTCTCRHVCMYTTRVNNCFSLVFNLTV